MTTTSIPLAEAMRGAQFVQLNGVVFDAGYLRVPDESTTPDDVVLELTLGDTEVTFVREEFDGAEYVGDGAFMLKSGALLRFLSPATLH
jgi:hypothetical protein